MTELELSLEELPAWVERLVRQVPPEAIILLEGPLGAGKTTLVREWLRTIGFDGPVRSPTFNLIHLYETDPPVAHIDLYRLQNAANLALEDLIGTVLMIVEWPDRLGQLIDPETCWRISIEPAGEKRRYRVAEPKA